MRVRVYIQSNWGQLIKVLSKIICCKLGKIYNIWSKGRKVSHLLANFQSIKIYTNGFQKEQFRTKHDFKI